ncbi:MAG TPA: twin-arginine translocase TatA/TatE family subunit [bacterium]|nr:twin-arginine translocase TatA/TatE family subunit [bacterium]
MDPKFWEMLVVLAIVILLFGPNRLAGLGAAVGKAMREFRETTRPDRPEPGASPENETAKHR